MLLKTTAVFTALSLLSLTSSAESLDARDSAVRRGFGNKGHNKKRTGSYYTGGLARRELDILARMADPEADSNDLLEVNVRSLYDDGEGFGDILGREANMPMRASPLDNHRVRQPGQQSLLAKPEQNWFGKVFTKGLAASPPPPPPPAPKKREAEAEAEADPEAEIWDLED